MPAVSPEKPELGKVVENKSSDVQLDNLQQIGKVLVESQQLPKFAVQTTKSSLCHMWSVVNALRMTEAGNRYLDNVVKINAQNGSFMMYDKNENNWKEITEASCKELLEQDENGRAFVKAVEDEDKFNIKNHYERTFLYFTYLNDKEYRKDFLKLKAKGEYMTSFALPYGDAKRTAAAFNLKLDEDLLLGSLIEDSMHVRAEKVKNALETGDIVVFLKEGHYVAVRDVVWDETHKTLLVTEIDSMSGKESLQSYSFDKLQNASFEIYKLPKPPEVENK